MSVFLTADDGLSGNIRVTGEIEANQFLEQSRILFTSKLLLCFAFIKKVAKPKTSRTFYTPKQSLCKMLLDCRAVCMTWGTEGQDLALPPLAALGRVQDLFIFTQSRSSSPHSRDCNVLQLSFGAESTLTHGNNPSVTQTKEQHHL